MKRQQETTKRPQMVEICVLHPRVLLGFGGETCQKRMFACRAGHRQVASHSKLHQFFSTRRRWTVTDHLCNQRHGSVGGHGSQQTFWKIGKTKSSRMGCTKKKKQDERSTLSGKQCWSENRIKRRQVQKDPGAVTMLIDPQKTFEQRTADSSMDLENVPQILCSPEKSGLWRQSCGTRAHTTHTATLPGSN